MVRYYVNCSRVTCPRCVVCEYAVIMRSDYPEADVIRTPIKQECAFCGAIVDIRWMETHKGWSFGGAIPGAVDLKICGFCYRSYACMRWMSGFEDTTAGDRDRLMIANVLRDQMLTLARSVKGA